MRFNSAIARSLAEELGADLSIPWASEAAEALRAAADEHERSARVVEAAQEATDLLRGWVLLDQYVDHPVVANAGLPAFELLLSALRDYSSAPDTERGE